MQGHRTRTARLCATTLVAAALGPAPVAAQTVLSGADSVLLEIATDLVRGREEANREWHQPWFTGEFLILKPEGGALAVFERALPIALERPTSFHPLMDLFSAYFLAAGKAGVPTRFEMPTYEGRRVVAFPRADSLYSIADPVLATVVAVYHEAFHLYQLRHEGFFAGPMGADAEIPRELIVRREFQDLAKKERDLLVGALYATNADSTRTLLRTYLATRAERTALLPAHLRDAEASIERYEASANLVGYRSGLRAVEGSVDDLVALISSDLRNTPAFDDPSRTTSSLSHWQIYATGSAIALLLERFGVSWKREVEQGATFVDLLTRAVAR